MSLIDLKSKVFTFLSLPASKTDTLGVEEPKQSLRDKISYCSLLGFVKAHNFCLSVSLNY